MHCPQCKDLMEPLDFLSSHYKQQCRHDLCCTIYMWHISYMKITWPCLSAFMTVVVQLDFQLFSKAQFWCICQALSCSDVHQLVWVAFNMSRSSVWIVGGVGMVEPPSCLPNSPSYSLSDTPLSGKGLAICWPPALFMTIQTMNRRILS